MYTSHYFSRVFNPKVRFIHNYIINFFPATYFTVFRTVWPEVSFIFSPKKRSEVKSTQWEMNSLTTNPLLSLSTNRYNIRDTPTLFIKSLLHTYLYPGYDTKLSYHIYHPSAWTGYDTRSIFNQSLTGLNSEFSFS